MQCYPATRIAKIKRMIIPSVVKDLEQLGLSYTASGNINWYNHSKKFFASIYVLTLTECIPSDTAILNPRYIPQRNACLCSPKNRYRNVYTGIISNYQKHSNLYCIINRIYKQTTAYS